MPKQKVTVECRKDGTVHINTPDAGNACTGIVDDILNHLAAAVETVTEVGLEVGIGGNSTDPDVMVSAGLS